jgi:hypothetical protein
MSHFLKQELLPFRPRPDAWAAVRQFDVTRFFVLMARRLSPTRKLVRFAL